MRRRIGVLGYAHETNARARPLRLSDGRRAELATGGLAADWQAGPALEVLSASGAIVVELPTLELPAGGPLEQADFESYLAESQTKLALSAPLDALLVLGHGAGQTTSGANADAAYLELVRRVVGPRVPIACVLDLHANLSATIIHAVDAIVGYRTNPHIDVAERCREAALLVVEAAGGAELEVAWRSLPLVVSQLGQLTTGSEPLGQVVARAGEICRRPVRNVSVFGGFALGDSPDAGLSVTATGVARRGCVNGLLDCITGDVADTAWSLRHEFRSSGTPLKDAIARARVDGGPLLLADVADNPGGGAPATSTEVLSELFNAGVTGVQVGLQCDERLVAEANDVGTGGTILAVFNRGSTDPLARPFAASGTVQALAGGPYRPKVGVYAGATVEAGACATIEIGGVRVGVSSRPVQVTEPGLLVHVGLRPSEARVLVVKSRGHFRAGFADLVDESQIVEVDAPGLTPVDLRRLEPVRLRRPAYPFDHFLDELSCAEVSRHTRSACGGRHHR